jgi:hypothetical protein
MKQNTRGYHFWLKEKEHKGSDAFVDDVWSNKPVVRESFPADHAVRAGIEDDGPALRRGVVGTGLGAHEERCRHQAVEGSTKISDSRAAGLRKNRAR